MENKQISKTFQLLVQLMELHDENAFKIKNIAAAAYKIDKLSVRLLDCPLDDLEKVEGLGKSTALKVKELLQTGTLKELQELLDKTPVGVVEMLGIKGIGPKKIAIIWKQLEIETVGELYYACNENRLIEAKGFGAKTQEAIKQNIEFKMAANGKFLYARVEDIAYQLQEVLKNKFPAAQVEICGQFRRKCEIIEQLEYLISSPVEIKTLQIQDLMFTLENQFTAITEEGLHIQLHFCLPENFAQNWLLTTGSEAHLALLPQVPNGETEADIYAQLGMEYILPELREGGNEVDLAKLKQLPTLISLSDLKGTLHNHSTWSDGVHTLEQMALYCKNEMDLEYLGICDHSKSAFYANGLSEERVLAQHQEIELLNQKLAPFKIFKGIESDILNDGRLDYADEILAQFDFVVASVHSNLKMDETKATQRLITAIENPYTSILGHPTGRLLLSRSGYPLDFKKVIDACAANGVVIEINANPLRLDLDWRWHRYALEKGVLLSINPDAHRTTGLLDMKYGIYVARKGGLAAENCLNSLNLQQITEFFNQKKANHVANQ